MPLDVEGMGIIIRNGQSKISIRFCSASISSSSPGLIWTSPTPGNFEQLTVTNSLTGSGVIYETLPRGENKVFTAYLPALNASASPQEPAAQPTALDSWTSRYRMVKNAYQTGMPPYAEAFHILNGSSMPDILYICDQLDNDRLLMLFQNLLPGAPDLGAGEQRLLAAILAVRNASTVGYGYTFGSGEVGKLNPDQQHDIREFVASKKLAGKWRVSVDRWQWIYQVATPTKPPVFDSERTVRWTDPSNNETGAGIWSLSTDMKLVTFAWTGSSTKEEWNMPVDTRNQTGRTVMKTGAYSVTAVKM
jgi:hypothetical protein